MQEHAQSWRSKAKELRAKANECVTPEAREAFFRLAKSYETMADEAEARAPRQFHDAEKDSA
jgi:hypothetical protein